MRLYSRTVRDIYKTLPVRYLKLTCPYVPEKSTRNFLAAKLFESVTNYNQMILISSELKGKREVSVGIEISQVDYHKQ